MTTPDFTAVRAGDRNLLTDVDGVSVGNVSSPRAASGVTIVIPDRRVVAACDVRGGAPCTRETDALDSDRLVDAIDAIALSGGSTHGLDAASGVVAWLAQQDRGYRLAPTGTPSPVVPAAALFDLANDGDKRWGRWPPYRDLGWAACDAVGTEFGIGNVGAGLGAAVGRLKGGLGSASAVSGEGLQVGALVAVNAFGSAIHPVTGRLLAEPWLLPRDLPTHPTNPGRGTDEGSPAAGLDPFVGTQVSVEPLRPGGNTTLAVVAVNIDLTPSDAHRIAVMAQDGLARAIRPVHTYVDGDVVFVISTASRRVVPDERLSTLMRCGTIAADCVARSIARGVHAANPDTWEVSD